MTYVTYKSRRLLDSRLKESSLDKYNKYSYQTILKFTKVFNSWSLSLSKKKNHTETGFDRGHLYHIVLRAKRGSTILTALPH